MTEGKPKRSYWRRGPRKKKGAGDAAGTAPSTPPVTEEGGPAPGGEAVGTPETGETFAPPPAPEFGEEVFVDAPPAEASTGPSESAPGETVAGSASTGEAPPKGRRRSRRRGKKKPGDAHAPASTEGAGETPPPGEESRPSGDVGWGGQAPPARRPYEALAEESRPSGDVGWGVQAEPAGGETSVASEAAPPGTAAVPGAAPGEPGKRRRRRRRRRRGKGKGLAQGEAGVAIPAVAAGDEEPETDDVGALAGGGTDAGEPDAGEPVAEPEYMNEAEEDEEEALPEEGTGAKKVMLIDGLHSEENRVAIVAEGNLDYYEVENQRRKAFKGNIYKAKVVNIAHAIEAAFVEFGGGRHGFMPLNEYCAGALMEHLGTWNEGDKRPPLRPGMEILVQVTKEESAIKGAAVTSYISIAGRYMVMMLGIARIRRRVRLPDVVHHRRGPRRVGTVADGAGLDRARTERIGRIAHHRHRRPVRLGVVAVVAGEACQPRRLRVPVVGLGMAGHAVAHVLREDRLGERIAARVDLLRLREVAPEVQPVDAPGDRAGTEAAPAALRGATLVREPGPHVVVAVVVAALAVVGVERRRVRAAR
ncbi:MAG TPA: hypothetical protein VF496_02160, partial [Candidatus Deferrimicrobium sp.]